MSVVPKRTVDREHYNSTVAMLNAQNEQLRAALYDVLKLAQTFYRVFQRSHSEITAGFDRYPAVARAKTLLGPNYKREGKSK